MRVFCVGCYVGLYTEDGTHFAAEQEAASDDGGGEKGHGHDTQNGPQEADAKHEQAHREDPTCGAVVHDGSPEWRKVCHAWFALAVAGELGLIAAIEVDDDAGGSISIADIDGHLAGRIGKVAGIGTNQANQVEAVLPAAIPWS